MAGGHSCGGHHGIMQTYAITAVPGGRAGAIMHAASLACRAAGVAGRRSSWHHAASLARMVLTLLDPPMVSPRCMHAEVQALFSSKSERWLGPCMKRTVRRWCLTRHQQRREDHHKFSCFHAMRLRGRPSVTSRNIRSRLPSLLFLSRSSSLLSGFYSGTVSGGAEGKNTISQGECHF